MNTNRGKYASKKREKRARENKRRKMFVNQQFGYVDRPDDTSGYIYVMDTGDGKLFKIGMTANIKRRFSSLKSANPRLSIVVAIKVKDMRLSESHLHYRFRFVRDSGEIFRLYPKHFEYLTRYLLEESNGINQPLESILPGKSPLEWTSKLCKYN